MKTNPFYNKPLIIAHRGASAYAPENTLPAFEKAIELGADAIELDVQLTKDEQVVVFHDYHVERTTNGTGFLLTHKLNKLKRLDAGTWFNKKFAGVRIPTLDEVFAAVGKRVLINIEFKKMPFADKLVDTVLKLIEDYNLQDRCFITSFDPICIAYARVQNPHIPTGFLFDKMSDTIWHGEWPFVLPFWKLVNEQLLEQANAHNKQLLTWTVNEEADMQRLLQKGIGRIITNVPDRLLKVLQNSRKKS